MLHEGAHSLLLSMFKNFNPNYLSPFFILDYLLGKGGVKKWELPVDSNRGFPLDLNWASHTTLHCPPHHGTLLGYHCPDNDFVSI